MRSVLVTGGAGFIGTNFVAYWAEQHPFDEIVVLDALSYAGNRANLASLENSAGVTFVHGSVRDFDLVAGLLRQHGIDTIVHFAAESHVDRSIHDPDVFVDTNILGTHTLLKAARLVWLEEGTGKPHRFHHISTDEVYGSLGPEDPPFTETTAYQPNSPYSASKAASDHLVRGYHQTYGLETSITNCSNNYGPYQFPEKVIPLFVMNALHGRALPIYGDGGNRRDWLHVRDHCRGIERVLDSGRSGEIYNIGADCEMSNLELTHRLCASIDNAFAADERLAERFPNAPPAYNRSASTLQSFVPDRAGHDRRYAIDASKIRDELGFRPSYPIGEGLAATVRWYIEHENWWRRVTDGG